MNTRMDLTWKKKSTELDFLNYTMDTHTTTFTLDGNEYEIKMVKMLQEEAAGNLGQVTAPEGDYYDVSFAYIDENGIPHIDITGKRMNRTVFKQRIAENNINSDKPISIICPKRSK